MLIQNLIVNLIVNDNPEFTAFWWINQGSPVAARVDDSVEGFGLHFNPSVNAIDY